ncbi:MAG TPA: hypothetical protein PLP17_15215 [Oligoflexia bacterium]|nr:hypothetical protein [Oligoflexia bacterium]
MKKIISEIKMPLRSMCRRFLLLEREHFLADFKGPEDKKETSRTACATLALPGF